MSTITQVSESTARKGTRFTFLGPAEQCAQCNLQGLCTALRVGVRYEIAVVRERKHDCPVFEGQATVVEYRELPLELVVEGGKLVEGAVMTYNREDCDHIGCSRYGECGGSHLPEGTRLKILELGKTRECTSGRRVVDIKAEIVE